jgi:hypothetical protein
MSIFYFENFVQGKGAFLSNHCGSIGKIFKQIKKFTVQLGRPTGSLPYTWSCRAAQVMSPLPLSHPKIPNFRM